MAAILLRTIHEATGMSSEEIAQVWEKMGESPFQKVFQYELEKAQDTARRALDTVPPDQFSKQQGVVQGLQTALGILNRPANVRSPLTSR